MTDIAKDKTELSVSLEKPSMDDIECFHSIFSDEETHHFIIDEGRQDIDGSQKKLAKLIEINGKAKRVFTISNNGTAVGFIVIHIDQSDTPSISYAISRRYWGNSFATRAITELIKLEGSNFKAFKAATHLKNEASQRVLAKSNFKELGVKELPMGKRKVFELELEK